MDPKMCVRSKLLSTVNVGLCLQHLNVTVADEDQNFTNSQTALVDR